jgi:hypothetical protein
LRKVKESSPGSVAMPEGTPRAFPASLDSLRAGSHLEATTSTEPPWLTPKRTPLKARTRRSARRPAVRA